MRLLLEDYFSYLNASFSSRNTSALNSQPHSITGLLINNGAKITIRRMVCTCKAGAGGVVNIYQQYDVMELEPVSATDLKCVWSQKKQSALEQYKAVPLMETDCLKEQGSGNIVVENLSTEDADNLRLRLGRRRIHDGDISYQIDNSGFECVLDNSVQSVIMMELSSNMSDIYMNNCCKINYNSLFFDDTISICVETKKFRYRMEEAETI
ncbi:hypothetical protein NQ317_000125 [Molorchus minor]|uniref:Uncharacterized protein n=1 Tax=Molorchus minor TaxID=1323400 RepID=A0ABQ9JTL6_9CUCU|nr:hypothetical protein NQ317_000125 [Molorchus minor]